MAIVGNKAASTRSFFPAPLQSLDACQLAMDLYIRTTKEEAPALYKSAGLVFSEEDRDRLVEQGVEFIYISIEQHSAYRAMLSGRVRTVLHDTDLSGNERREIIAGICARLVDDAMQETSKESLESLFEVGDAIGRIAATEGDQAFSCLLDMSGHDFYTATHMMNVGIGCGLLARAVKPRDREFASAMIRAGLVHDLGKAEVPAELLNKEGRLTEQEFEIIKAHPMNGVRALRELGVTDTLTLEVTRDHHEHMAGTGYPRGIDATKLTPGARIAAIVDVYDALTSARPYRAPIAWRDALEMMDESRGSQFDPDILDLWKKIVENAAAEHADELPTPTADARSIDEILPHDEHADARIRETKSRLGLATRYTGHEKRTNERVNCSIRAAVARVLPEGESKQSLDARVLDISRCGIRFACHDRFESGALLRIRASLGSGKRLDTVARVVRPSHEPNRDGLWEFGCKLISASKAA